MKGMYIKMSFESLKRILICVIASSVMTFGFYSCNNKSDKDENNGTEQIESNESTSGADEIISMPEGEEKAEEIIINENYADSELFVFEGTVDEIYEDGSILVYSPDFRVNYNYKLIVEFDENSVIDGFELSENQHIRFEVYSAVKKSKPLTMVASKLTLVNEVSTQREKEAERIAELEQKIKDLES